MPYEIEVVVNDVAKVKLLYNEIHLYRFENETEIDAINGIEIMQMESPPTNVLDISYSIYIFVDAPGGVGPYWYRARYEVPVGTAPTYSSFSDPIRGGVTSKIFHDVSYPDEVYLSTSEFNIINKIRILIGDKKRLVHDYISDCKSKLSDNKHTLELGNKGWPVYINLNAIEKTRVTDPYVDDYHYLTFSGSIADADILDIYYYSFRNSDNEIYNTYTNTVIPAGLTSSNVTADHLILQAAIDILEAENWAAYNEEGVKIREGDSQFDPSPGFAAREKAIARLHKRLDDLVAQYLMLDVNGVLVD